LPRAAGYDTLSRTQAGLYACRTKSDPTGRRSEALCLLPWLCPRRRETRAIRPVYNQHNVRPQKAHFTGLDSEDARTLLTSPCSPPTGDSPLLHRICDGYPESGTRFSVPGGRNPPHHGPSSSSPHPYPLSSLAFLVLLPPPASADDSAAPPKGFKTGPSPKRPPLHLPIRKLKQHQKKAKSTPPAPPKGSKEAPEGTKGTPPVSPKKSEPATRPRPPPAPRRHSAWI